VHVSQMGPSVQVVVGAGGRGGPAGAFDGRDGGESCFGNFVCATGGAGGVGEDPRDVGTQGTTSNEGQGPAPGAGSGSANPLVISGGRSTVGFAVGTAERQGVSSRGGNSKYGFGGHPRSMQSAQRGFNGTVYGSGGGGAYARGGQNAAAGGNGAHGLVIVETVGIHRDVIEYGLDGALLNENRQPQGKSIGFSGSNNFQATVPGISNEDGAITTVEF